MAKHLTSAGGLKPEDRLRAQRGEMSFWEYDEKGYIIAGSPERVRQRIRDLAVDLRIGQLIACLHMGNLSEEQASENTRLFGAKVIPHLRDLWADQPDHWTPAVSQQRIAGHFGGLQIRSPAGARSMKADSRDHPAGSTFGSGRAGLREEPAPVPPRLRAAPGRGAVPACVWRTQHPVQAHRTSRAMAHRRGSSRSQRHLRRHPALPRG